ncbi:carbamoyltransferase [Paraburkholderia sp. RAU6.4a]|uniref:carbamoyltransferase family protein n=1 Tax=unclassified Paraburkholderia TaxID=2615204 RepID=UPI001655CE4C|nr:carbamoyltransferase C-terminal domain-containing protein [Paraburkholderia sp. 31.1]MBC8721069.1 carbamoyltransferase [Paraburkholderia sp. 31.1]
MNILGLNYIFHDSSACVVADGELLVAVEDERLTGEKHSQKFPERAIESCLARSGLKASDIDHIAISFNPNKHVVTKALYAASLHRAAGSFISYEFLRLRARQKAFWSWYNRTWDRRGARPKVHFIDHHLSHIGGSYFVSPFDEAALLSIDGWGEWSTTWLGHAKGRMLQAFGESLFPHSLGCFYSAATEFCGFKPNYDEGKTMGLAPCGDPERFYDKAKSLVRISAAGEIELDLSLFDFPQVTGRFCNDAFYQAFGAPRKRGAPFEDHHRDVAAAFQRVIEESILQLCRVLEKKTVTRNLVLAGGVSLNSVANGRVMRETQFKNIYVMPGAGDNGTCIGAAYYLYNGLLKGEKRYHHEHPYIGTEHSNEAIEDVLRQSKVAYRRSADVCAETASILRKGKIVAWFQGKMEFGPRSLGGRSILADPTLPGMKDKINAEVKHRELFRPFAPSVAAEDVSKFFDFSGESPFMLMVCDVLPDKQALLPAITHVDGTARLQTVSATSSRRYYGLIKEFEKLSGIPVILNTSFNIMDQPIIESPLNAIRCFFSTGLDVLVMGDFIVEKAPMAVGETPVVLPASPQRAPASFVTVSAANRSDAQLDTIS